MKATNNNNTLYNYNKPSHAQTFFPFLSMNNKYLTIYIYKKATKIRYYIVCLESDYTRNSKDEVLTHPMCNKRHNKLVTTND